MFTEGVNNCLSLICVFQSRHPLFNQRFSLPIIQMIVKISEIICFILYNMFIVHAVSTVFPYSQ